jgi:hypothetical protein
VILSDDGRRKAMASLVMLVTWKIWNKRNARIFKNENTLPTIIFSRIKLEARVWVLAGIKHLGIQRIKANILPFFQNKNSY